MGAVVVAESAGQTRPMTGRHPDAEATTRGELLSRVIGLVLAVVFGAPFVVLVWVALSSRFGAASADPHGFALIFGTVLALGSGLLLAIALPLAFPRARRGAAYLWCMLGYLAVAAVLIVALVTA